MHEGRGQERPVAARNVLVLGAYGTTNVGDEAILESILATLAHADPEIRITVLSNDEKTTAAEHGVSSVFAGWRRHLLKKIRLFQSSDLLICGGGGLLQDTFPNHLIQGPAPRYSLLMLMAHALGCRVIVYGQGVGPLHTRYGRWISGRALRTAHLVTVRDLGSAQLVAEITRGKVEAHAGVDPAVLLDPIPRDEALALAKTHGIFGPDEQAAPGPVVAVCPRPWYHRADIWPDGAGLRDRYVENMSVLVSNVVEEMQGRVLLLPFDREEDLPVCREIRRKAGETGNIRVASHRLCPREMMGLVSLCDVLVGTRLHSLIFATRVAVPSIAVAYDPKVANFMKDIRQSDNCLAIETFDPAIATAAIRRILSSPAENRKAIEAARDRLLSEARETADLLLQCLAG
ncbi:MAG: polysaccharide pyruvyl transferase family protein [Candidatus Eisenbacteria sp.]|nr:polysaccharide pyruvyl transferase family protein [Candidatus Eisenbacteria bacterium]